MVVSGALYLSKLSDAVEDTTQVSKPAVILLVLGGSATLVVSFMGCWGAARESPCLLCSYAFVILLILVAELVIAALVLKNRSSFEESATSGMLAALERRSSETGPPCHR